MKQLYDRIILIDDDGTTNFYHKDLLGEIFPEGEIFVFENGNDFLDQLNSGKLNQNGDLKTLVLLDINMPEIWGLDLLNNLDEDYDNIEYMDIIMVSSSKLKSDVEKSSRYNSVLGYLEKPLNIDKINSILTK
jgi:response regulator of citrate/malate metabolism